MEFTSVQLTKTRHVAELTLNRPQTLNAMTWTMLGELDEALTQVESDPEVRALILTGSGRGFCAGFDWNEDYSKTYGPDLPRDVRSTPFGRGGALIVRMWNLKKPIIGAINGPAVGGGFSIACLFDFRIVSERASFSSIFVKRGIPPDGALTYLLPKLVGLTRALDIMITGRKVEAQEAVDIGLANRLIAHDDLLPQARALAEELADGPALAIEFAKELIHRSLAASDLIGVMGYEALAQKVCWESEDAKEGQTAFLEKRSPVFTGR